MKSTVIWSLVGLNFVLAAVVVFRAWPDTTAHAQAPGRSRLPSEYVMIPGQTTNQAQSVIYVVDTTNGSLSVMAYDESRKRLDGMQAVDLNRIFAAGGGAPAPAGKTGYR